MLIHLVLACGEPARLEPPTPPPSGETGSALVPSGDPEPGAPTDSGAATDDTATGGRTTDTADTGRLPDSDTGFATFFSATCTLADDNALRAWCDLEVSPPRPVEVTVAPAAGGPARVYRSEAPASSHRIGVYIMSAETEHTWVARPAAGAAAEATGAFTTGALPVGAQLEFVVDGSSSARHMLLVGPCEDWPTALVTTTEGEVVWYQEYASDKLAAVQWTEDDTLLALIRSVEEVDWMGRSRLVLTRGVHFDEFAHHDLFRRGGYTYVLFRESVLVGVDTYKLDGFHVFDADGMLLGSWHLRDHWLPPGPDPRHKFDASHGNAIWVGDDGIAVLSLRHMSTVIAVAADPLAVEFGEVVWRIEGNPDDAEWDSDFEVLVDGQAGSFEEQHHASFQADGRLTLFDNRIGEDDKSRGIELELDAGSGVANIVQEYILSRHCPYQGGSARTASGHPVLTCAPARTAYEFAPGGFEPRWSATVKCANDGANRAVPRFTPLPW